MGMKGAEIERCIKKGERETRRPHSSGIKLLHDGLTPEHEEHFRGLTCTFHHQSKDRRLDLLSKSVSPAQLFNLLTLALRGT